MRIRIVFLVLLLLVTGVVVSGDTRDHADEGPGAALQQMPRYVHQPSHRGRVVDGFYDVWLRNERAPFAWSGDARRCRPGTVSSDARASTLAQINYFRALARLRPVRLVDDLSGTAQRTALIMHANQSLSHSPPPGWACRTDAGARLAGRSNLALGSAGRGASAITQYVLDPGRQNKQVGHRRWMFNPRTAGMATGSTTTANALAVVGMPKHRHRVPRYVPWPPAGFVPSPLEPHGRWSLSASRKNTDFRRARVRVLGPGGRPVRVKRMPVVDGMGPNTLVWKLRRPAEPGFGKAAAYRVKVQGVRLRGRRLPAIRYTVRLVRPDRRVESTRAPEVAGTFAPGETVYAYKGTWDPEPSRYLYQWTRDGWAISGATTSYYRIQEADAGHTVAVRVTATAEYFRPGVASARAVVGPGAD